MSIYEQLGQQLNAHRAAAQALEGECDHPSTHIEEVEHDQLPGQQGLYRSNIEVCDVCDQVVEEGDE